MQHIINILYYVFGIALPVSIIFVAIFKKSKRKLSNIVEKTIIAGIIFVIFYILKLGVYTYLEGDIVMSNTDNTTTTEKINKDNTSKVPENDKEKVEIKTENGITYVNGILIVNKSYSLPENFVPTNTYEDAGDLNYCAKCLNKEAYNNFIEMSSDATSLGLNIWIQSGYRSYELQNTLYTNYVNKDGKEAADTYSARPGHSEHQTGLAFDLNTITDDFQYTDEGKWVNNNAYRYGFILRYPKGKENYTGYKYESWHLRYVGKELAEILYNNGDWITLEEHFGLTSDYDKAAN